MQAAPKSGPSIVRERARGLTRCSRQDALIGETLHHELEKIGLSVAKQR
jgi:hypothetical protein